MISFFIIAGIASIIVIIASFIELSPKHDNDLPEFDDIN